ncbi:tellurite resistance TerB family protein [Haliea atlantica]
MIRSLVKLFAVDEQESPAQREHRLKLAAAALLVETARSDFEEDAALEKALRQALDLPDTEVRSLLAEAGTRADHATSLYEFTRVINDHFSPERKRELVALMWQVAWADGSLHHYEEHLIRKVAELIYVPHEDFIRAKLETRPD